MEYDAGQIAEEAIRAMGITDLDRFRVTPEQMQQRGPSPSQQMMMMEKMRGANVQPQENIDQQVQAGNLVPLSEARRR